MLFDCHERPDFALEGQKWTSACKRGNGEESNVQTQLKEYIIKEVPLWQKLELLREKSSSLEESCNLLTNEKHSVLVYQLESVEAKKKKVESIK